MESYNTKSASVHVAVLKVVPIHLPVRDASCPGNACSAMCPDEVTICLQVDNFSARLPNIFFLFEHVF